MKKAKILRKRTVGIAISMISVLILLVFPMLNCVDKHDSSESTDSASVVTQEVISSSIAEEVSSSVSEEVSSSVSDEATSSASQEVTSSVSNEETVTVPETEVPSEKEPETTSSNTTESESVNQEDPSTEEEGGMEINDDYEIDVSEGEAGSGF